MAISTTVSVGMFAGRALDLSLALLHPVYDCIYLAVAIELQAVLVTADDVFADVVAQSEWAGSIGRLGAG